VHDIGLELVRDAAGEIGFRVLVGGGMGRTPILGAVISDFLPWQHMLTYCEAILRVYNRYGRRDNPTRRASRSWSRPSASPSSSARSKRNGLSARTARAPSPRPKWIASPSTSPRPPTQPAGRQDAGFDACQA
jgi:sulfite reductase (NADPH) hemoprotein beta-component